MIFVVVWSRFITVLENRDSACWYLSGSKFVVRGLPSIFRPSSRRRTAGCKSTALWVRNCTESPCQGDFVFICLLNSTFSAHCSVATMSNPFQYAFRFHLTSDLWSSKRTSEEVVGVSIPDGVVPLRSPIHLILCNSSQEIRNRNDSHFTIGFWSQHGLTLILQFLPMPWGLFIYFRWYVL